VSLSITAETVAPIITDRTRAVLGVHYAGASTGIAALADSLVGTGVALIEDAAHAFLGTTPDGRLLGTYGAMATFSFHDTKNFSMGEGGALCINDPALVERAEIIREKGTNRKQFLLGLVDKYTWVDVGGSYVPSDLLAGLLLPQLETADAIQTRRSAAWHAYAEGLAPWGSAH
jgi:dTDP-4-amino-4,6-dideoxygalactose transaminase